MTRNHLVSAFFILLLVGIFIETFRILSPFLSMILCAALLAFGFYPVYGYLTKKLRRRENLAAFLTVLCILLAVVPLALIVIFNFSNQILEFLQKSVDFVRGGGIREWLGRLHSVPWIQRIEPRLPVVQFLEENLNDWVVSLAKHLGGFTLHQFGVITRNIFYFSIGFVITLFLVYVFLKHGGRIYRFLYEITPLEEGDKEAVFRQIRETSSAVIHGQIVTSIVQAVCAGLVFYFLALPVPLFIAAATFLSSMIPVVGASTVWVPFVVYLLLKGQVLKALLLLFLGVFLISAVDNFLKPAIIGEKTKLPYFLLFLAILGGLKVYGFLGIFLGPVVMSLFFALVKIYREKYLFRS